MRRSRPPTRVAQVLTVLQAVLWIVLPGPFMLKETPRVIRDLGVSFPLSIDSANRWESTLKAISGNGPLVVLANRGTNTAVFAGEKGLTRFLALWRTHPQALGLQ